MNNSREDYGFNLTAEQAREEWRKALLSGEYQQCTKVLRRPDDTMCCLGVATEVFMKFEPGIVNRELLVRNYRYYTLDDSETEFLLPIVSIWLDINKKTELKHPSLGNSTWNEYFVLLNDIDKKTFEEIATVIPL